MPNSESLATQVDLQVAHQLVGKVLAGRYEVASLIGIGSMAAVYLVHHVAIRKRMAVKVLHPSLLQIPEMLARFEREALVAGHLEHPHVAAAQDFGRTEDGGLFFVLEYIEGRELRAILKQGPVSIARTIHIARQIASMLELAHGLQIIHRDLKPENIMLTRRDADSDYVKILDFGLAKVPPELRMKAGISVVPGSVSPQLTKIGSLYGTPGYMAPEQAMSEAVDGRCDLYALGSILYEMLTGRTPFDGNTVLEIIDEHVQKPLPPMRQRAPAVVIPEPVETVVRRLLAKRPEDRFRDPRELLTALEHLAATYPLPASAPTEAPPTGDSLIMTVIPGVAPPAPTAVRKGTIVAMPLPGRLVLGPARAAPADAPGAARDAPAGASDRDVCGGAARSDRPSLAAPLAPGGSSACRYGDLLSRDTPNSCDWLM